MASNVVDVVKGSLRKELSDNAFRLWIEPLNFNSQGQDLDIHFPNSMHLEKFKSHYLSQALEALQSVSQGSQIYLKLTSQETLQKAPVAVLERPEAGVRSVTRSASTQRSEVNRQFTFEEFVVGPDNQMALASCQAVAKNPAHQYNPLFLYGGTGLGKTHLLQAIANFLSSSNPDLNVIYTNCESFTNEFIESIKGHTLDVFRNLYRSVDVLIVDDIQFLADKNSTQEEFFHTFNDLISADKQVIVSSDSAPLELKKFEDRLISRFSSGLVASINEPGFETRLAIIRQKSSVLSLDLSEDVTHYLAQKPITNIRELRGLLITLNARREFYDESITTDLIQQLFPQYTQNETESAFVDYEQVLSVVTEVFKVRLQDLQSKKRHHSIVRPRHIAMYLLRTLTKHSLEEIGAFLGGRDHSSVQYAQSKISQERSRDTQLNSLLLSLEEKIVGQPRVVLGKQGG